MELKTNADSLKEKVAQILQEGMVFSMVEDLKEFQGGRKSAKKLDIKKEMEDKVKGEAVAKKKQEEKAEKESGKAKKQEEKRKKKDEELRKKEEEKKIKREIKWKEIEEERKKGEGQRIQEVPQKIGTDQEKEKENGKKQTPQPPPLTISSKEKEAQLQKEVQIKRVQGQKEREEAESRLQNRETERQKQIEAERIKRQQEEQKRIGLENQERAQQEIRAEEERQKQLILEQKRKIEERKKIEEEKRLQEEELKRQEEIKRQKEALEAEKKRQEEVKREMIEAQGLEKELAEIEQKLQDFPLRKKPLELKRQKLEQERESSGQELKDSLSKEEHIERQAIDIEAMEKSALNWKEKRQIEEKRWLIEKQRRQIEKTKWDVENHAQEIISQVKNLDEEINIIAIEEKSLLKRKQEISWRLQVISFKKDKWLLSQQLHKLSIEADATLKEKFSLEQKAQNLRVKISDVLEREAVSEKEKTRIDEVEKTAATPEEEKGFEQNRWQAEEKRREIEQERWALEEEQAKLQDLLVVATEKHQKVVSVVDSLKQKDEDIDILIKYGPIEGQKIISEKNKERQAAFLAKPMSQAQPKTQVPPANKESIKLPEQASGQSKKEILFEAQRRQAEILREGALKKELERNLEKARRQVQEKATEKDKEEQEEKEVEKIAETIRKRAQQAERGEKIKQIRESAQRAREAANGISLAGPMQKDLILKKLTKLSPEERRQREEFLARVGGKKTGFSKQKSAKGEVVFRPIAKQPSFSEKLVARLLVVILLIALFVGIYLLVRVYFFSGSGFGVNPVPLSNESNNASNNGENPAESSASGISAIVPPVSLIGATEARVIDFSADFQIPSLLTEFLREKNKADSIIRVLFRDSTTGEYAGLALFLKALGANINEKVLSSLGDNSTLFVYFSKTGRLIFGFASEAKNAVELEKAMKEWEATMAGDFWPLFSIVLGEEPAFEKSFKANLSGKIPFRYLDSLTSGVGVCYSVSNGLLIFTTGGEAIIKIISLLGQ